jgi:hypothetical protein
LDGSQDFFLASRYLYSSVIDLTGFQSATLSFYDVGDFSSAVEDGILYISTNSATAPGDLPTVQDFSDNAADSWQLETVDLTPWVGNAVQLVFYYEGVVFGDQVYGWTLDDFSVTGVAVGGAISITKNLGQGTYALASLASGSPVPVQSGVSPSVTLSNLAPGSYMVEFGVVPYYVTPGSQTNTLAAGGTLSFSGNYYFIDANNNGMSDAWEMAFFGSVSTNRIRTTDTDHDGMTDYAEFIAGTDPTDPTSLLHFTSTTLLDAQHVQLQWTAVSNRLYQLNVSSNLATWSALTGWMQASANPIMSCTVTNSAATSFYRIEVRP